MAVRNCKELGLNLQKIVTRLMANNNLVNLLYYNDFDPLAQTPLSDAQKRELVFNKLIKIIPRVDPKETANSIISLKVDNGILNYENSEFRDITIGIEVFVPLSQWIIKDSNLRPFAILGEIQESLNNKIINGIGRLTGGSFSLQFLTDEIVCYKQDFSLIEYD